MPLSNNDVPQPLRAVWNVVGDQAIVCKCGAVASAYEICNEQGYTPGECFVFSCAVPSCKHRCWAWCTTCNRRFNNNNTKDHVTRKVHKNNAGRARVAHNIVHSNENDQDQDMGSIESPAKTAGGSETSFPMMEDGGSIADMSTGRLLDSIEEEMVATFQENTAPPDFDIVAKHPYPKINTKGNEWLVEAFKDSARATPEEVGSVFSEEGLENMRNYWMGEHACPAGFCGGGIQYLVARTFQSAPLGTIHEESTPNYPESKFHIENFLLYQSLNDSQRHRQARISETIMGHVQQQADDFFKHTHIPTVKEQSRMYGKTGKQSIYNCLDIPEVMDIGGVAYIEPLHIIKFLFANGVPVDDILVEFQDGEGTPERTPMEEPADTKVHCVSQCKKAREWKRELTQKGPPSTVPENKALVCWLTKWKDGFGHSRVKNNRGSTDCMSFTCSPPKDKVNASTNTFLLAIGLKKAKGWRRVHHLLEEDMRALTNTEKPILVYHGVLEKVIPVVFQDMVTTEDKPERASHTGTISFASDIHRCFGVIGSVRTPRCKTNEAKEYLKKEREAGASTSNYGWSKQFIDSTGDPSGAKLPSCNRCRKKRLVRLGVIEDVAWSSSTDATEPCYDCTDWRFTNDPQLGPLRFPKPADYPTWCWDSCPVEPIPGREVDGEEDDLPFIELTFEKIVQSAKYTHYHANQKGNKQFWTKAVCLQYMRCCGVSEQHTAELYQAAVDTRGATDIDYDAKERVGVYRFLASWVGDLPLKYYIEALMHLLFLGNAESILELATKWTKGAIAPVSNAKFRRGVQPLLQELRTFQLSWLHIYPFSGKETDYKTGSWVSENWLALVRIFPIVFGWCWSDHKRGLKDGAPDLARLILGFHALVSRLLTHGGIDKADIDECEDYMKEFMSSLQEFDVRVRYQKLGRKAESSKDNKKKEAWWAKSNFLSLFNLLSMMDVLGPLVLWWDGGGKGERFVQEVKPHIKKGVREDAPSFFAGMAQNYYKLLSVGYMEARNGLTHGSPDSSEIIGKEDGVQTLMDAFLLAEAQNLLEPDEDDEESGDESSDDLEEEQVSTNQPPVTFSQMEEAGMYKKSTIYIYRNRQQLQDAINNERPIAGILQMAEDGKTFEFNAIFRKPVKQFGRRKVLFSDHTGVHFFGMWYSEITVATENETHTIRSMAEIQEAARMSAVAIPLWYILGQGHPNSSKYCVITNWWKPRNMAGDYCLPTLDPMLYGGTTSSAAAIAGQQGIRLTAADVAAAQDPNAVI